MVLKSATGCLAALSLLMLPTTAFAQSVNLTRSILPDQPYTLIYPDSMLASGGGGEPLTINNPAAPLQCVLQVVPADDTGWTAENAVSKLDDGQVAAGWTDRFPGFAVKNKSVAAYQSGPALQYEGTSTDSPMGVPLTIVHTETVANARGYVLDCYYDTKVEAQARPIVDFIIANFSTKADTDCCVGATPEQPAPTAQ